MTMSKEEQMELTIAFTSYDDIMDLILDYHKKSEDYKWKKLEVEQERADKIISINWTTVNNERVEQGLPKLSNQDMKDAYIDSLMVKADKELLELELEYNLVRNLFKVAMEYSFEAIR